MLGVTRYVTNRRKTGSGFGRNAYQAVLKNSASGIYKVSDKWYFKNFTTVGAIVDMLIKSVVGTSDGAVILHFDDLSGITIISYLGSAVPTINGNNIEYSAGDIYYLELSNGSKYGFKSNDNTIYDYSGNGKHATIEFTTAGIQPYPSQSYIQALADFWANKSEYSEPIERIGYSKYLICDTAGHASYDVQVNNNAIPAYGTWEFTFQVGTTNNSYIDFIKNTTSSDSYQIIIYTYGKIALVKNRNTVLFQSVLNYIDSTYQYNIKITRNRFINEYVLGDIGTFAVYIKGGQYGENYILITVDTGTNPILNNDITVVESFDVTLDADTLNDTISHITKDGVSYDISNFVIQSGDFSKVVVPAVSANEDAKGNPVEVPANCGYSNSGSILNQPDDATLKQVDAIYNLGWYNAAGDIEDIDYSIAKEWETKPVGFKVTQTDKCVRNMITDVRYLNGSPLEAHPNWELIDNEQGGNTRTSWHDFNVIHFNVNDINAKTQNLAFNGYSSNRGTIAFDLLNEPGTGNMWVLFAAKMLNARNVIGVRINGANIEIVKRKNGLWSTVNSVAKVSGSRWVTIITDHDITLFIDMVEIITATHNISGVGNFGMSMHRVDTALDLCTNYEV